MILDLDTSHDKFNRLCKHTPKLFQPLYKVGKRWKSKDLILEEIGEIDQKLIGICVKALKNSLVIPKLRQILSDWKLENPGKDPNSVRHLTEFRYGYDSFSFDMFNNMKNSLLMLKRLPSLFVLSKMNPL